MVESLNRIKTNMLLAGQRRNLPESVRFEHIKSLTFEQGQVKHRLQELYSELVDIANAVDTENPEDVEWAMTEIDDKGREIKEVLADLELIKQEVFELERDEW